MIELAVLLYLVCAVVSYAAELAFAERSWPSASHEEFREKVGLAVACGLIPMFWPVVLLTTGFYAYGFLLWRSGLPRKRRLW